MGGSLGEVGVSPVLPELLDLAAMPDEDEVPPEELPPAPELSPPALSEGLVRPTTAVHVSSEILVLVTGGYRKAS